MEYYSNTPSNSKVKKTDPNQISSYDTEILEDCSQESNYVM